MEDEDEIRALILSDHMRKKRNAESWSLEQEQLVIVIGEKAECYRWMHARSAEKKKKWGNVLNYSAIGLSLISGFLNLVITSHTCDSSPVLVYTTGALSLTSVALSTVEQFGHATEAAAQHTSSANGFSKLIRNIGTELALNPEDRRAFLDYLSLVKTDYETLVTTSPDIDANIIDSYRDLFPHKRNLPEIAATDTVLHVYRHNPATVDKQEYERIRRLYNMRFGEMSKNEHMPSTSAAVRTAPVHSVNLDDEMVKLKLTKTSSITRMQDAMEKGQGGPSIIAGDRT